MPEIPTQFHIYVTIVLKGNGEDIVTGNQEAKLTLDMDPEFQRRLKTTAALKGVSMRQYCLAAITGRWLGMR